MDENKTEVEVKETEEKVGFLTKTKKFFTGIGQKAWSHKGDILKVGAGIATGVAIARTFLTGEVPAVSAEEYDSGEEISVESDADAPIDDLA